MSRDLLIHGIFVGLAGLPRQVQWFETDDALRDYLKGNLDAPRMVAHRDSVTIPGDVWCSYSIDTQCLEICREYGCELIENQDGSRTFRRKPSGSDPASQKTDLRCGSSGRHKPKVQ